ncbi:MAG: 4-carboxymuconolactone decarboxylase, partial [Gammaproteobacteria bacterium]
MSKQSDRRAAGIDVLRTLSGGGFDPARAARGLIKRHGALGTFAVDHVLGTLWARPQLSRRDRSLIVLSFLCCLGGSAAEELGFHVKAALNHGLSREQIDEIVTHAAAYAGIPLAMACSRIVSEVWATLDGTDRAQEKSEARFQDDPERWQSANEVRTLMFGGRNAQDPAEDRAAIVDALGGVGEMAFDFAFGELWAREALSRRDRS